MAWIWSVLVNVPYVLEQNVYSVSLCSVLWMSLHVNLVDGIILSDDINIVQGYCIADFCLLSLSVIERSLLKSSNIIVGFPFLVVTLFLLCVLKLLFGRKKLRFFLLLSLSPLSLWNNLIFLVIIVDF